MTSPTPNDTIKVNGRPVDRSLIKGLECVFATYSENKDIRQDLLVVKENVWYKDGTVEPNIRLIPNRKWPFYITKEGFRNHNDKKEWEDLNKLQKFYSTRVDLVKNIIKANGYGMANSLRQLGTSPYLYGTDLLPTSHIKTEYRNKFKDCQTITHKVAALDSETDVEYGTQVINMLNISFDGKAYTAVTEKFVNGIPDFIDKCHKAAMELMPQDFEKHKLQWEIEIVKTPGEAVAKVMEKAHQWKPDFISIWNIAFDIKKMVEALEKDGIDPAYVFSDPCVPDEFKYFSFKEGPAIKVTQSGAQMSIHPADRWHVVTCPASFYFLDSMCLYKRIRTAAGNENSYALDYILNKNKVGSKLSIKELEHLKEDGDKWHFTMQRDYKPEYVVYNLRDDIALLDLDEKIGDICRAFPALAGISDYSNFNKNPRRIADDLHGFVLERGKVIAATPEDIAGDPLNDLVLGMRDWIVTLPSYTIDNGMNFFENAPDIRSMIYRYLADLDVAGTYPNGELVQNISKETTAFETCKFEGMSEQEQRYFGLNMTAGPGAALELGIRYLGLPSPQQLLEQFDKDHALS